MALSLTYTTLKSMLQAWLADTGTDLSNELDNIIGLGELKLQRDLDLEILDSETTGTFTINDASVSKPSDIVAIRSIHYTNSSSEVIYLTRRTVDYVRDYNQGVTNTGDPEHYAELSEDEWIVSPVPSVDHTYTVRYIKRPTGLSASNATSWMSDNAADALFYACMLECETFTKNEDDGGRMENLRRKYEDEILPRAQREVARMMKSDYSPMKTTPPASPVG